MKKTALLAAAAVLGLAHSASAADLAARPMYTKAPMIAAPTWTGFYLGANAGFGGGETRYVTSGIGGAGDTTITSSGFIGGGQIGYNWQAGGIVFGLETDFQGSSVKSKLSQTAAFIGGTTFGTKTEDFGTVRGRLGFTPWDRSLLYATGGLAYGHTSTNLGFVGPGVASPDIGNDKLGWTAGAGLEYMIAPKWSVKTEYLYVDLGRDNLDLTSLGGGAFGTASEASRMHIVRAGVNYHF